jgi:Inositol polyphosphate kinase
VRLTLHAHALAHCYNHAQQGDTLQAAVTQFFHNGDCLRVDVIPPLLRLLEDLAAAIKASPKCRFYSSSLLLIYDGAGAVHCCSTHDSSSSSSANSSSTNSGTTAAAAAGATGKSSNSDGTKHRKHSTNSSSNSSSTTTNSSGSSRAKQPFTDPAAGASPAAAGSGAPAQVDVRMIDFANSLCTSRAALAGAAGGAASYDSGLDALHPEDGCLLGLRNIIAVLTEIHRGATCAATSPPSR